MLKIIGIIVAGLALAGSALPGRPVSGASSADPATIDVMVLGTYHFANPGRDLANARIDPVTTPEKQRELEALAQRIEAFRPTLVAVERVADDPETLIDPYYAKFTPDQLTSNANERVQIGYRIARNLGLRHVYAIDEQPGPGEPDYFPFDKVQAWAKAHGQDAALDALIVRASAISTWLETAQRTRSVSSILAEMNRLDSPYAAGSHGAFYYGMLPFGGADGLPGAELNGRWYMRNVKIWAKLMRVAKPGDRVLIVYGAGHNYWLRHFAGETPGYRLVEVGDYLDD